MMSDTDFERGTLDINGDFLLAYSEVISMDSFPNTAEVIDALSDFRVNINGVEFNPDIRFGVSARYSNQSPPHRPWHNQICEE